MSTYPAPHLTLNPASVTTALELPGYRIVRNLGVVRGIVVRSRNVFATVGAGIQTLIGGDITIFTELCEKTRQDSFAWCSFFWNVLLMPLPDSNCSSTL